MATFLLILHLDATLLVIINPLDPLPQITALAVLLMTAAIAPAVLLTIVAIALVTPLMITLALISAFLLMILAPLKPNSPCYANKSENWPKLRKFSIIFCHT